MTFGVSILGISSRPSLPPKNFIGLQMALSVSHPLSPSKSALLPSFLPSRTIFCKAVSRYAEGEREEGEHNGAPSAADDDDDGLIIKVPSIERTKQPRRSDSKNEWPNSTDFLTKEGNSTKGFQIPIDL